MLGSYVLSVSLVRETVHIAVISSSVDCFVD